MGLQHLKEKTKTKMKTTTLKAIAAFGLTALLAGSAAAQESKSKPVGYETLTVANGFNYLGLRLHEAPVVSNAAVGVAGAVVTVPDGIADALQAGTSYLFEVVDGDALGAVVVIDSFDAVGDTVTVADAALGNDFAGGDSFTIRPQASLASVFGADNSAGLDAGFAGTGGADQVWVPNGSGGFNKYYFDSFNATTSTATWTDADTLAPVADAAAAYLFYADGLIVVGDGNDGNTFVVSGSVKLTATSYSLANGFNYLSSVSPAGASLGSMFGEANAAGLSAGFAGTGGADQVWIPAGGTFEKYYYDSFNAETSSASWSSADTLAAVDSTTVSLDDASGFIIVNDGAAKMANAAAPSFYSTL
ncbi:MAG: hypothetical protein QNL68_13315 [Akkermansiaceae bacterium]|jgi:hypothetical protein